MKKVLLKAQIGFSIVSIEESNTLKNPVKQNSAVETILQRKKGRLFTFAITCLLFLINFSSLYAQSLGCCKLHCRDTTICFDIPDSLVILPLPEYRCDSGTGGGGNPGNICIFDSMWNNSPGVFPVGTTVVTWFVSSPFGRDSCTQNIIRNPPSVFSLCFTTSPPIVGGVINICNGTPITFNANCSIGISGLIWNFGNGYYSGNPVHTEPAWHYPPGTYYDTLTVYDDCGNPHDTAFMVVVDSASGPDITCISVVCPGDTVTYHTSAICTSYTWSVTGGVFYPAPTPTSDSVTVVWGAGPNGTISLSVAGCTPPITCTVPTIKTVKIVPATLPVFGDTIVCAGAEVTYCIECIPGNNHIWEMTPANAGTITGQGTCCITIKLNPTFFGTITLTINYQNILTGQGCNLPDNCTNDPGCGGSGHLTIQVKPIFGISGPSKVCPNTLSSPFNGMNLTTNAIEPLTSWNLRKNNILIQSFPNTAALNSYSWNGGVGMYQLTAYAPPGVYCNDSAFISVEVVDIKIPNPILGPDTVCPGVTTYYTVTPNMGGVSYTWSISPPWAGTLIPPLNGSSIGVQWNVGGGTLSVVQTLTSSPFCVSAPSPGKVVKTWPNFPLPVITPSGPTACLKGSITYSIPPALLSNATYTWSVSPPTAGNITTANGTNQITIQWIDNSNTPIFVKLKITRCYTDSVMLPVTLFNLPLVPNISYSPLAPCVNNVVNFSTTSPGTWNWNFGDLGTSTLQNPPHIYTTAGNYNVVLYVTNAQGCSDTAKTNIKVDGKPVVPNIAGPSSVCLNTYATYSFPEPLYPGASYTWSLSAVPKGTIISSSSNSLYLKWTSLGIDTVKVHVQSTCLDTIIKFPVTINALPTPGISVPSPACEGTALTFIGSGGVTYSWLFSGGVPSSSNVPSPVVNYPVSGVFGVSLTVTNAAGCIKTTTQQVTINPKPIAIITGPFQVCAFPATVTLSAVAMAGYTFAWTPSGSGPSISPTISSATTFTCVVTNAFGCTRTSNSITVDTSFCPPPDTMPGCFVNDTINFTHTPPVCLSTTFTKTGTAALTGWNFGDGGSAGPVSPIAHTYPYPGIFLVTVQGSANGLDINGIPCVKPVSKYKFVTIPFNAKFTHKFQCNGTNQMQVLFTNTSEYLGNASSYQWNWYDNGNPISNLPFPGPITISPAGPHVIDLTIFDPVTLATCTVTHTINVPSPIVAAFSTSSPACQNSPVTFTDNSILLANEVSRLFTAYPAGPTATGSPDSMIYTSTGSFTALLSVTDIYGCTDTATQIVNVLPASTGTITVSPNNCDSVQLTAAPGAGPFTWILITPPPFPDNPVYVKTSGFYKVKGISPNGCPYTVGPVQVTVKPSPNATISGKVQYCQGEKLDIKTSSSGTSIIWNQISPTFIGGIGNMPNLNIIPSPAGSHTYQVIITGANSCTASATYTIFVDSVPPSASIVASGPLTFCDGDSVILTVNPPGATYLWSKSPTPPLSSPANTNDSLIVKVSGTYSVIVQTASGCAYPAIAPKTITVNPNPVANITGDTVLCEGETLVLNSTNLGGVSYAWTGPAGNQVTNPYIQTNIQLSDSGYYVVTVTDNTTGCSATDSVKVIVNPAPAPPVIVSNPGGVLCQGPLFNMCVVGPLGPPITYSWNTGQMGPCINAYQVGSYYTVATNQYGCTASSNVLTINPLPDLSCVPSGCYEFCNECSLITIPGVPGFASYSWEILIGNVFTFYSATQNLSVTPPGGKFRLVAANQFGCTDTSDTLEVTFYNCCEPIDTTICVETCIAFNDQSLQGFQPNPSAPNVGISLSNVNSIGGITDYYIAAQDQPGPSKLSAGQLYLGKWCCGELCFDYKLIDDGQTGSNVNPEFEIKSGTLGFRFTSNTIANQGNGWHQICAPITDCTLPPVSASGVWTPIAGTLANQWLTVLSFVTELNFRVDYTAAADEISGYDNVCLNTNVPDIDAGADTTICAGGVVTLEVEGCNGIPEWYEINGNNLFLIGNGPIVDVNPTQTTCYIVICCTAAPCCCDTDTVCIYVNPLPVLSWPVVYPDVCLNSLPVYLDTLAIAALPPGGTGVFSGINVLGNYFYPNTLGLHLITYTYTDTNGCTNSVTNTINVIYCCDTSFCHVDLGSDTTVCTGSVLTLYAQGCGGTSYWYELGPGGPIPIGQGGIIDITPQQNTCYMVICCCLDPVYNVMCCDTDTICVNVYPLPTISWPVVYPDVCLNSSPVYLDTLLINVSPTGGTGVFSGVNVLGYYFYPNTLGLHTITYTYTDTNGCTKSASNTINVIYCCDTSFCHVDLGSDTTVCTGSVLTLYAQGCGGTSYWYELGPGGPVPIGQGGIIDITPQQNTCYMVICCCLDPVYNVLCCDTDTICVNVYPLPTISWPVVYPDVCLNSAPVYLDTLLINVSPTGGTGFFSGPNVSGYYFFPNTLGLHTITYTYTDTNGCTKSASNTINVIFCCDTSSCHVDIIGDTIICEEEVLTLEAQGCSGSVSWYELGPGGPVAIGQGPIVDVFPQVSTCYVAICCCQFGDTVCCTTDTICVTVNPLPTISWPLVFPNVCLNSAPVYLDTLNISVSPPGGFGVFLGPFVVGNYFYPNMLGTFVIAYCYTDTNGCMNCVYNTITVEYCCDTSQCHVDVLGDTTICAGEVTTLTAQGCSGTITWHQLTPEGPIQVGNGPIFDAFPQQSTCYLVICCCLDPIYNVLCCDTDTVCITVNPLPIVSWPVFFPNVCNNSSPVYLDTLAISVSPTGGTGSFSGIGVIGNYFYPGAPGAYTITYCYVDLNGCTTCVNNTIIVDFCCDTTTCHVDIYGDTTICSGEVAILNAQGCNGTVSWYQLTQEGPILVGNGPIFDAFPQQSTCYMVICCCLDPIYNVLCCDTDTVCITVNPLPIVSWPVFFPNVCNNSSPVYLDTLAISVSPTGGTGSFSGIGVVGNYFYPGAPGAYTITYCYVDLNGCTTCVNNTIIVDFCCDTASCHVDIYGDTTICSGEVAILTAQGCNGTVSWYQLTQEGPVLVGNGPIFDAFPQQSTCYMIICCCLDPVYNVLCCDTDTVCITVNPLPTVSWPVVFPDVCHNSAPVYLDTLSITVFPPGGTGSFSGIGVTGNYFYPGAPGVYTIAYCYTDTNGCTKCVYNTITVNFCCDTLSCQVDAGSDTTICSGGVFSLNAQGCNGTASWYELGVEGPILIGNGPIVDIFPQQSMCYMVVCCCPDPVYNVMCCDTDTICITVKPSPILTWPLSYMDQCLNAPPVFLNPNDILVLINNVWVPIPSAPGSGYFSGPGVFGSSFYPTTLGLNTITYYYTDTNGCTGYVTNTINVINCDCDPINCNCNLLPPPPGPTITINSIDPDDCNQTGCIHATFTGCCLMYSYTFYDPCRPELSYSVAQSSDSLIFCNLRAGTYTIYVQDACGNFAQQNVVIPLVNGPLTAVVNYSTCGGPVCVTATGGCPPYSYNWIGGNTTQCITGGEPCTETAVVITDSRGCSITKYIIIPGVTFTNVVQPSCCLANGSICVSVCFGPQPYHYEWSSQGGPIGGDNPCLTNLAPGTYCLTVTNALGQMIQCCYTLTGEIIVPPSVSFVYSNCGSSVTAIVGESHCQGYTYYWDNNSRDLVRDNIDGCDSLTFSIETCDGNIYHHGFTVPDVFPSLVPVSCATGIGGICIDVDCFRCPPYTYTWTPVGGSSVVGNSCYYTVPGFYNVCITNSCGDVICCRVYLPPPICNITVDVHVFLEGYYTGGGLMNNYGSGGCLYVNGISMDSSDADTIFVSAMDTIFPYAEVERKAGILKIDGSTSVTFGPAVIQGNSYYLMINHRNALETWSANPVLMGPGTNYNFTLAQTQAYGNNMIETFDNMGWTIYSGDINDANYLGLGLGYQDGLIDGNDYGDMETAVFSIYGGYTVEDITGDGLVSGDDYGLMETNVFYIRSAIRP